MAILDVPVEALAAAAASVGLKHRAGSAFRYRSAAVKSEVRLVPCVGFCFYALLLLFLPRMPRKSRPPIKPRLPKKQLSLLTLIKAQRQLTLRGLEYGVLLVTMLTAGSAPEVDRWAAAPRDTVIGHM
jgi:hypothetical protein